MNQPDSITFFIDSNQSSAHEDHVSDLREVLIVKLGLSNFDTKRVLKFQSRQWPFSTSDPRQDLLSKGLRVQSLSFNPLYGCGVLVIGFGSFR